MKGLPNYFTEIFPVPAFPVKNKESEVFSTKSAAMLKMLLYSSGIKKQMCMFCFAKVGK